MPSNIEIKARARDFGGLRERAGKLSDAPVSILQQEDTFFNTPQGRLKLRVLAAGRAQLIYYERADQDGPKRSDYHLFETDDPQNLKTTLTLAYGVRGVVKKTRYLYLVGQTRVHLDHVEGLGDFLELEVVMQDGQSDSEGQAIAEDLMRKLGISRDDLLEGAYIDMLEKH
ncbi:MAG TPA: class IV adenylate cyclase [Anaerolineales bacterium]